MTTTLFIATSLDGYIAGPDDDLSWLFTDADYGFDEFFSTVDGLIMGRGTYEYFSRMEEWPYRGRPVMVVSRSGDVEVNTPDTILCNGTLEDVEAELVDRGVENAWVVGGGELVRAFLNEQRLDRLVVSLHPVLLGKGVPLFPSGFPKVRLELVEAESFPSGLVQITYDVS